MVGALGLRGRTQPPPERYYPLPAFRLTERSLRPVTLSDLAQRRWIASFIFTRCAGTCPMMMGELARLRPQVPDDVVFVSFTVDPVHDTPGVLADYARRVGADPRWLFLTGEERDLYALAVGGFKLATARVPESERATNADGPFLHSSRLVLVDGSGFVRGYYESSDPQARAALVQDVEGLGAE